MAEQERLRAVTLSMGEPYVEKELVPVIQGHRDANCARRLPSVRKDGTRDKRVAIAGYGPSLAATWPRIAAGGFEAVWTVSKAHDFLVERGVVPTHHTDSDYREHKAHFNRLWGPETNYWMATQVHPVYLDLLAWHKVRLFHVVQPGGGTFDGRYLKVPVMFDAGLQAARLAYEMGYRQQEWFGMDASVKDGATHAGSHEGMKLDPLDIEIAGEMRVMNAFLVRQALFAERMLRETPKMKVKILGDGALRPFLQERRKCSVS